MVNDAHLSRRGRRRAFTLLEMLMVVAIFAMLALLVMPVGGHDTERSRLNAAAEVMISDIELAQVMTISAPRNPVVIQFEPGKNTYWLARAAMPDKPIIREQTNEPYLVQLGEARAAFAEGVTLSIEGVDDDRLTFSAHGGLADPNDRPLIRLRRATGAKFETHLSIAPITGTISTEQSPVP